MNSTGTAESTGQFAGAHLWASAHFCREAYRLEQEALTLNRPEDNDDVLRYNVVACIMTATAAVEAYVCEETVMRRAHHYPNAPEDEILEMLRSSNIKGKYDQIINWIAADHSCPKRASFGLAKEWNGMGTLVELRNRLVHFAPERGAAGARDRHDKIGTDLAQFITPVGWMAAGPLFPTAFHSFSCAKWAVTTARDFIGRFARHYGLNFAFITKESHHSRLILP